jgi:hypothetical protein
VGCPVTQIGGVSFKILIAIKTCHAYREKTDLQRRLWLHRVHGADVRFFFGRGATRDPLPDEVFIDCDDSYAGIVAKGRAMLAWAWENGYDYVFYTDDDVYIMPERLLRSDFYLYDYVGRFASVSGTDDGTGYASGGPGIWLSRHSLQVVIDNPPNPKEGSDDRDIGLTLGAHGIKCHLDQRYCLSREWKQFASTLITCCSERQSPTLKVAGPVDLNYVHQMCYNRFGQDCR